jgi:hypothetical protein
MKEIKKNHTISTQFQDRGKNSNKLMRFTLLSRKKLNKMPMEKRTTPSKNVIIGGCNLEH